MTALLSLKNKGLIWNATSAIPPKLYNSELYNSHSLPFGISQIDNSLPHSGLPSGSINEFRSNEWIGKNNISPLSFFCHLAGQFHLARCVSLHLNQYIAWIGEELWPSPHFLYASVNSTEIFKKSYFIKTDSNNKKLWVLNQTLKTKGIGLIFSQISNLTIPTLRRFSLYAKENDIILFLLRKQNEVIQNACLLSRWEIGFSDGRFSNVPGFFPLYKLKLSHYKGMSSSKEWTIIFNSDSLPEVIDETISSSLSTGAGSKIAAHHC
jgi:hypothetical protein